MSYNQEKAGEEYIVKLQLNIFEIYSFATSIPDLWRKMTIFYWLTTFNLHSTVIEPKYFSMVNDNPIHPKWFCF